MERLHLLNRNVLDVGRPLVDVVAAMNFSYSVFKQRSELLRYFRKVRRSLRPGGIFFVDSWGGFDVMSEDIESRKVPAEEAFDGTRIRPIQVHLGAGPLQPGRSPHRLPHSLQAQGRDEAQARAFSYDWRLWTLPELQELMLEAGFKATEVHIEGWDDEADDADGVFRKKRYFENQSGWVAYVVGLV